MNYIANKVNTVITGMGPRGLAMLAMAMSKPRYLPVVGGGIFGIEKNFSGHTWSTANMFENARLQNRVFKDLAFLDDPTSHFTLFNYLKETGVLCEYIVSGVDFASRKVFFDYLRWAADKLKPYIFEGTELLSIAPFFKGGAVTELLLGLRQTGKSCVVRTKNVVINTGFGNPRYPLEIQEHLNSALGKFIYHNLTFHSKLNEIVGKNGESTVLVLGGGQSAAETILELIKRGVPRVISVSKASFFQEKDHSPFVNRIFTPQYVDEFYNLPEDKKVAELERGIAAHQKCADARLLPELFAKKIEGVLEVVFNAEIEKLELLNNRVYVSINNGRFFEVDAIVCATGVSHAGFYPLLENIRKFIELDKNGRIKLNRDYSLKTVGDFKPKVFLTGSMAVRSHGLAVNALSLLPFNSRDILESILDNTINEITANRTENILARPMGRF